MEIRKRELRTFLVKIIEEIGNGQQQQLANRDLDVEKIEEVLYELGFKNETAYRGLRVEEREYYLRIGKDNERMTSYPCTIRVRISLKRGGIDVKVSLGEKIGFKQLTSENYIDTLNNLIDDLEGEYGTCFKK